MMLVLRTALVKFWLKFVVSDADVAQLGCCYRIGQKRFHQISRMSGATNDIESGA